jgi:hypothetical protein
MARKKKTSIKELNPVIKVKLDSKTIITLKDMAKFDFWKNAILKQKLFRVKTLT